MLKHRQVCGVVNYLGAGVGNAGGDFGGVGRRHDLVVGPHNDEGRSRDAVETLVQTLVGNRPEEFGDGAQGADSLQRLPGLLFLGVQVRHGVPGHGGFRVAEEDSSKLGRGRREVVHPLIVVEPEARGGHQHELSSDSRAQRGHLRGDHRAEVVPDDVRRVEAQGVEQVVVVQGQVKDIVQVLDAVGLAEPGLDRRVDREPLGQPVEEGRPSAVSEGAVEVDQRIASSCPGHMGRYGPGLHGELG